MDLRGLGKDELCHDVEVDRGVFLVELTAPYETIAFVNDGRGRQAAEERHAILLVVILVVIDVARSGRGSPPVPASALRVARRHEAASRLTIERGFGEIVQSSPQEPSCATVSQSSPL
ncbi:hypothetical protein [Sorangium sp. So ce590]|uniref:hypothetical protein n=1 Tax=unclassified Sorangium TaxID=2621164 RepID=UPI003F63E829